MGLSVEGKIQQIARIIMRERERETETLREDLKQPFYCVSI